MTQGRALLLAIVLMVLAASPIHAALGDAVAASPRGSGLRTHPFMRSFLDPFEIDFWSPFAKAVDQHWSSGLKPHHHSTPEITETETYFYITVDTAGYTKEELDVHVLGDQVRRAGLSISNNIM